MITRRGEIPDVVWEYIDYQLDAKTSHGTAERLLSSVPAYPVSVYLACVHDEPRLDTSHNAKIKIVLMTQNVNTPEKIVVKTLYVREYDRRRPRDPPTSSRFIQSIPSLSDEDWKRYLAEEIAAYSRCSSLYEVTIYIEDLKKRKQF